jgi:LysR family transcriptional regulator, nitrogen assimilation regulatory protein
MDLKRVRTFVTVADLGTVSKAALHLHISQSALSRQISDLEDDCGFKLFDRIGRRLFLTTRGEQLLGDCRGVLGQLGSLGQRIELLRREGAGVIKLAAPPQTIESILAGFLPRYAAEFPNIRVKLVEALGMDQVQLLERGEVHFGIRHDQGMNPWFESIPLPSDDVLAAYSPKFQLGDDGAIDIVSLTQHPLLLLDSGYSVRRLFNAACRLANVEPEILVDSRAPHTLLALAEAGQGVAVIPSVQRTDGYKVNIARVTHRRKPLRDRYVIQWDKRRPMPTYVQNFCTQLATYMREVLPVTRPSYGKRTVPRSRSGATRTTAGKLEGLRGSGGETGRSAGAAADKVRACDQPQDRQGARPHRTAVAAGARRRGHRVNRRELIAVLGAAALVPPPAGHAQQQKAMPVIGYMSGGSESFYRSILPAFREALREQGYIEGQNVTIEYRWAEGDYDRLPAFAAEFVSRKVDVIAATGGEPSSRAAKAATSIIPIVFTSGSDPVADGRVASLARPGGNLTGVSFLTVELHPKRFELISEMVPQTRTIGMLVNPNQAATENVVRQVTAAATAKGIGIKALNVSSDVDLEAAFASVQKIKAGALIVQTDPLIDAQRDRLIDLAARFAVPAIYGFRQFAVAGGLMSYGVSIAGVYHQAGVYVGKILKGANPAELPVQQPTTFELVINMKPAKALGLTVPRSLLARADELIE